MIKRKHAWSLRPLKSFPSPVPLDVPVEGEQEFLEKCPVRLFDHQVQAIRWMVGIESIGEGGIFADDMGLGKTVVCLSMITRDRYDRSTHDPTLVVVTLPLLSHWKSEAMNKLRFEDSEIRVFYNTDKEEQIGNEPLVITTYETIQGPKAKRLYGQRWKRVFLDEAHTVRNSGSKTFRAIRQLCTGSLFCVTGTPIVNYPEDVGNLSLLCTRKHPFPSDSARQHEWKSRFILRRTKDASIIPPKIYRDVWLEMTPQEEIEYRRIARSIGRSPGSASDELLINVITRLRQACDHPLLIQGHQVTENILFETKRFMGLTKNSTRRLCIDKDPHETPPDFPTGCKMDFILKFLGSNVEKTIVFSHFTTMLDLLEALLTRDGLSTARFDGTTKNSRENSIDTFKNDPHCKVLLASFKAGGVGLNLTCARNVILVDPWWNSSVENQAIDRVHRIGQTGTVTAIRLLVRNTIEEEVIRVQNKKNVLERSFYEDSVVVSSQELRDITERINDNTVDSS